MRRARSSIIFPCRLVAFRSAATIIDGTKVAKKVFFFVSFFFFSFFPFFQIRDELASEVAALKRVNPSFQPTLAIIQLGTRADSSAYVAAKMRATEECGLKTKKVHMSEETSQEALVAELNKLNEDPSVHGIIVQMPLPKHIDSKGMKFVSGSY